MDKKRYNSVTKRRLTKYLRTTCLVDFPYFSAIFTNMGSSNVGGGGVTFLNGLGTMKPKGA